MREVCEQSGEAVRLDITAGAAHQASTSSPRVLVVDDEQFVLAAVSRILRLRGYSVITQSDGAAALEGLGAEEYDVIVSDIAMPGMDGSFLMRAVRDVNFDIPIILATGSSSLETAKQAIDRTRSLRR